MTVHEPDLLPLQPLLDHLAVSIDELGRECGVSPTTVRAARATGLTATKARAWCHHAGVDFDEVWRNRPVVDLGDEPAPAPLKIVDATPAVVVLAQPALDLPDLPDGMEWVDEPPPQWEHHFGAVPWAVRLAALEAAPGRWVRIKVHDNPKSAGGQAGSMRKSLGPGWEVIWRRIDAKSAVYARFIGSAA